LVEFYYLWKKTPGANQNRPHRRRRQGSLRRIRNTRTNSNASNNNSKKEEETPEPVAIIESQPSSISKEENSSVTEDDVSECDSDSSTTNKGSTATSGEFGGNEESPSRMRTRNKQTKEQLAKKRTKRTDTSDVQQHQSDLLKMTPSKAENVNRKINKPETPSKTKKRANEAEIETSGYGGIEDSKDNNGIVKRKRLDSPTESLTTDSRPGSVLDEAESNSELLEGNLTKYSEEKDPLFLAANETQLSLSENEKNLDTVEPVELQTIVTNTTNAQNFDLKENIAAVMVTDSKLELERQVNTSKQNIEVVTLDESKIESTRNEQIEHKLINTENEQVKEQEMLTKLANMKQEGFSTGVVSTLITGSVEHATKETIFIKNEPDEEDSINNSNSNEPHDLKLKVEIKSELKSMIDNVVHDCEDTQQLSNNESFLKSDMKDVKFRTDIKLSSSPIYDHKSANEHETVNMKYITPTASAKYNPESQVEYDMKVFIDQNADGSEKFSSPFLESVTNSMRPDNTSDVCDARYYQQDCNSSENSLKYPEDLKSNTSGEHTITSKAYHPYDQQQQNLLRNSYESIKFDQIMKYGLPSTTSASQITDLKYLTPEQQQQMSIMKYSSGDYNFIFFLNVII
jgi:hypothetical protein